MRGASGVTGSSPMCSSTTSEAAQSACTSTSHSSPSFERRRQRVSTGSLAVDADRQTGRLAQTRDELARPMRLQRAGRVVQQHARGPEVRKLAGLLHQRIRLTGAAGAVDEPRLELPAGPRDCIGGLTEIRDVVERIVKPEDVDSVLRGGRDESADEVVVDRPGADEEAASKRQAERCLDIRLQRSDALPGALDTSTHRTVEATATRDLEVGEPGAIEDSRDVQLLGSRQPPGERLLPEQANSRVGKRRHAGSLAPPR